MAKKIIVNKDGKDVKYIRALIQVYGKHVLEADLGYMVAFKCLETKLGKTTQFLPKSKIEGQHRAIPLS